MQKYKKIPVGLKKTCIKRKRVCAPAAKPFCVRRSRGKARLFRAKKQIPVVSKALKAIYRDLHKKYLALERTLTKRTGLLQRQLKARIELVAAQARQRFGTLLRQMEAQLQDNAWKAQLLAIAKKHWRRELAQAKRLAQRAGRSRAFKDFKRRHKTYLGYAKKYSGMAKRKFSTTKKRFVQLIKKKGKAYELLKKIMFRVARKQIDRTLRAQVAQLSRLLGSSSLVASTRRKARTARASRRGKRSAKRTGQTVYDKNGIAFAVMVALSGGIVGGLEGALGIAWDDKNQVRGIVVFSYWVGLDIKTVVDFVYMVHPGRLDVVQGVSFGASASGAYYGGANIALEWNQPEGKKEPFQPVPAWGFGPSLGIGGGVAFVYGGTVPFPPLSKTRKAPARRSAVRRPARKPPRRRATQRPCQTLAGGWTRTYKVRGKAQRNTIHLRRSKGNTYTGRFTGKLAKNKSSFRASCTNKRLTIIQQSGKYKVTFKGRWQGTRWVGTWSDTSRNRGTMTLTR